MFHKQPRVKRHKSSKIPVLKKIYLQEDAFATVSVDSVQMDTSDPITVETIPTPFLRQDLQLISNKCSSKNPLPSRKGPDSAHRYPP